MSGIIGGAGSKSGVIGTTEIDYESGTFTATLTGGTSAPSSAVTQTGYYTKVGQFVHASVYFSNVNTTGASGGLNIQGMPFTCKSGSRAQGTPQLYNHSFHTSYIQCWSLSGGGTTVELFESRDGTTWTTRAIHAGSSRYIICALAYQTE